MPEYILAFGAPENGECPLTFDGDAVGAFTPPGDAPTRDALLALLRAGGLPSEVRHTLDELLQQLGLALSRALFVANPELWERYEALPPGEALVLAFAPKAQALAEIPWEYAWDLAAKTPLAAARPLARRLLGQPFRPSDFHPLERAPRLLAVIAEPAELHRFGARRAHDILRDELAPLVEQGRLAVDFLRPPATPEKLDAALRRRAYDALHVVAHGAPDGLALEGDDGRARDVNALQLRARLRHKGLRLVVLTSCLTGDVRGAGDGGGAGTGLTRALLEAGIPQVVAMQFPAEVEAALRFAGALYAGLAGERGLDLMAAVHDARQGEYFTQAAGVYEWGVPVVYRQGAGVPLFPAQPGPGPDRAELQTWPPPSQTNAATPKDFVGRGAEMAEVLAALQAGRLAAVTGSGGIGKTELARAVSHYLADRSRFADGISWSDLETAHTLPHVLEGIAAALGLKLDPQADPLDALGETLNGWEGLLVLDNLETALDNRDPGVGGDAVRRALGQLFRQVAAPCFLITSRSVVGLGEREVRLGPMATAEGVWLFLAAADRAGYHPRPGDGDALAGIVALLDNYPLALVLAAPHLRDTAPATLLERLETEQAAVLRNPVFQEDTRLTSFYTSIGLSVDRLSDDARRLFGTLSVFEGGAFGISIEAVYGKEWRPPLEELLRRSLALPDERARDRYTLLAPVRRYAETTLDRAGLEMARRRAAIHYEGLAEHFAEKLSGPEAIHATQVLTLELPNLRAGVRWAVRRVEDGRGKEEEVRQARELVVGYAFNLYHFLDRQGHWQELAALVGQGVRAAEALGKARDTAGLKTNLATVLQHMGQVEEAARLREEAQESLRRLGGRDYAVFLYQQGIAAQAQGDYAEARRLYAESQQIAEQLGNKAVVASSLHQLGMLAQDQGDYAEARRLYAEAAATFKELGAQREQAAVLHELGRLAQDQGDYAGARRLYAESLHIKEQLGDKAGVASSLGQLGILAQAQGDYAEARHLYAEAAATFKELGAQREQATVLHQLGRLAQAQGDYAEARRLYAESLHIKEQLGNKAGVALTLGQLGLLAEAEGRLEEAVPLWLQAAAIFQQLGSPQLQLALQLLTRARETLGEGRFRAAARQAGFEM